GATAADGCSNVTWTNNFDERNFIRGCNESRNIDVTFYATDECGNVDSITLNFSTGDNVPPVFTNCPRPPVIVDAPLGWCSSFVNFSLPLATDNCGIPYVLQTDTTGLSTGSLFPVGLTILEFTAFDSCGNSTTCELKIVVNDFHTPPTIECRADTMRTNDLGMCGAVVNGLAPKSFTDNCIDNVTICYEIFDSTGTRVGEGIRDASGFKFPVGKNRVKYTIRDQASLLITEVVQNGTFTGVEISNLGGAIMDISCLRIVRKGSSIDTGFTVANGVMILPGGVFTQTFPNIPLGEMATYSIEFLDRVIDEIKINAAPLVGSNIIRVKSVDSDSPSDWVVTNDCDMGSYGVFNQQLDHMPANGKKTSLQSKAPSVDTCSFFVTIRDVEAPMCATNDTLRYELSNRPIG
ncbi:MAG TPA: HYR domain-containing protein, partial [Saprospiraceae bacterium]|nr:HYR domain-containing protein [Saprospiraceae bacterium]